MDYLYIIKKINKLVIKVTIIISMDDNAAVDGICIRNFRYNNVTVTHLIQLFDLQLDHLLEYDT